MRRKACALLLTATLGGCMSMDHGPETGPACTGSWGKQYGPPSVPGLMAAHGQNVPMIAPYTSAPPGNAYAAAQMMNRSVPLDMVQINRGMNAGGMVPGAMPPGGGIPPTPIPPGGVLTPPGLPFAPGVPAGPNFPPGGFNPAGAGLTPANVPPGADLGQIMAAQYVAVPPGGHPGAGRFVAQRTQVRFTRPTGMKISWFTQGPDGKPAFSNVPLEAPARYNFPQAAIYRLKLSNIEGRPGLEIYPTMEVVPCNPKTESFLAHSAVPLEFSQEDFRQVAEGNFVTKVIYLPDPQFQDVAGTGIDEIVSTRLEPGADPVQEALRRGSILLIIRMGNVDQEAPNTPPLGAQPPLPPLPPGPPHQPHPHMQVPYLGNGPLLPPHHGHGPALPPGALPPGALPPGVLPPGMPPGGPLPPRVPGAAPGTFGAPPPGLLTPPPSFNPGAPTILTPPSAAPSPLFPPTPSPLTPNATTTNPTAPSPVTTPAPAAPKSGAVKVESPAPTVKTPAIYNNVAPEPIAAPVAPPKKSETPTTVPSSKAVAPEAGPSTPSAASLPPPTILQGPSAPGQTSANPLLPGTLDIEVPPIVPTVPELVGPAPMPMSVPTIPAPPPANP